MLVAPDDDTALAEGVELALADAARLGAAGRARARERFSVARMTEATISVYEEVVGARLDGALPATHPPPDEGGARA